MSFVPPFPDRLNRRLARALLCITLSVTLTACSIGAPTQPQAAIPTPTQTAVSDPTPAESPTASAVATTGPSPVGSAAFDPNDEQPVLLTGTFTYTNDFITTYYVEHAVALIDMYGFVTRDQEWELPVEGQVLGYLDLDEEAREGSFRLQLPAQPTGTPVQIGSSEGVQIFALSYSPNLTGDPFSVGDDRSRGWPAYLASTVNDPDDNDEVTGGKLLVWAPDAEQQFPTGFGADGKLFTDDDPLGSIPQGYSVIDLDGAPFIIIRNAEVELTLHEPNDAAVKDYSDLSYTEAFDRMFEQVRTEYAFNGIEGKEPDWDTLYEELAPRVAEAERRRSASDFYLALFDFAQAFKDGHVGLRGGGDIERESFVPRFAGGYGFAIRKLDDGRYIVTYVMDGGPAANAGVELGAEITTFNDQMIDEAVSQVEPFTGPFSTDFARQYEQQRFLLRAPIGTTATITFANPGGTARNATLEAIGEFESLYANDPVDMYDPAALPVEFSILESGLGYVRVNSNSDDLNLLIRLFERALQTFEENELSGIIIDMRVNGGGAPLGLAGYLTDQEIEMAQLEYYSEATGQFEAQDPVERIRPKERQFRFDRMAVLVDQTCYSACELEAYGFSQVPGMIVVGQYPTAGVEAEVARGQYEMPEGFGLQIPTGRFTLPNGEIFLEGQGVEPTVRVPIDEETVLAEDDVVLRTAVEALLEQ